VFLGHVPRITRVIADSSRERNAQNSAETCSLSRRTPTSVVVPISGRSPGFSYWNPGPVCCLAVRSSRFGARTERSTFPSTDSHGVTVASSPAVDASSRYDWATALVPDSGSSGALALAPPTRPPARATSLRRSIDASPRRKPPPWV
jgi:hypothetical protein